MATELFTPDELVYKFNPNTSGSLHFKVRAANDAHVALTSGPEESDPMYEVFIGGWSNSKSVVRRNRTKPDVAEVETPGILSDSEFRGFWITWDNGTVAAGKEGEAAPFLTYTDPEPFGIGYYGVCTGWGASGTWIVEGGAEEIKTIDGGDCLSYTFYPVRQGSIDVEVRTPSNAHIALTKGPKETEPMYEIMLGGWENTASVIRYNRQQPDKVRVDTPQLVSDGEFRRFLVEWEAGHIRVIHRNETIIDWRDPQPIGISHFGVRTAWGASGHWKIQPADPRRQRRVDDGEEELKNEEKNEGEENQEQAEESHEQAEEEASRLPPIGSATSPEGLPIGWNVPLAGAVSAGAGAGVTRATTQPGWNVPEGGTGGSGTWVDAAGGEVPSNAVPGGFDGEQLYVARARHEGALIPGKLVPSHGVVYVPWGGAEHGKSEYEVLTAVAPNWVAAADGGIPAGAVSAGETEDGETIYIGRVEVSPGVQSIGKIQKSHNVCYIPYGGLESSYPEYEVLVSN